MDNVMDLKSRTDGALLIDRISQAITINGKTFVIEEPSRKRLNEYIKLSSDLGAEIMKRSAPIIELRSRLQIAMETANTEDTKQIIEDIEKASAAIPEDEITDDRLLKFILGEQADQDFLDNLGIKQKAKIIEIAEEIYGISDMIKKGQMILPGVM